MPDRFDRANAECFLPRCKVETRNNPKPLSRSADALGARLPLKVETRARREETPRYCWLRAASDEDLYMATHPYISGATNIAQMIKHLRNNFPGTVTSETVKKLGLASNNESFVINALQFIGVINAEGKKTDKAKVLTIHKEEDFQKAFEGLVREAYGDLFELHGDQVWNMTNDDLVNYFRQSDQTSSIIGQRQARVFRTFAALAGHGELEDKQTSTFKKKASSIAMPKQSKAAKTTTVSQTANSSGAGKEFAMTVRIEINLPPNGTPETYDAIFKSIKANLLNE
jgi:hypothetical protein